MHRLSSINTISGNQIPIFQITISSVSNYTSMSSLAPIVCHCYGGSQVVKKSSLFLSPLKCPMAGTFYRSPAPGEPPFMKAININLMMEKEKNEGREILSLCQDLLDLIK
ncbi:uncharacterized protein LOC111404215 isoform X1 [Olea europaea var. sylvestris]|uniref:uncharacterized protein LOC111404215 isoform X1 n=1 Tax=Olea europaea var. sylvestris TaxID=158386 RepID=UPI000C1D47A6|nr:uncharacterized protein LOC111404215 isoform X1 [Olea europaea var. sylvestris]